MSFDILPRRLVETLPADDPESDNCELEIDYGFFSTPLGRCFIGESKGRICFLAFAPEGAKRDLVADLSNSWPGAFLSDNSQRTGRTIREIFPAPGADAGSINLLVRGTRFQVEVWKALLRIPTGSVRTYSELAQDIGRPQAARAVGSAVGANPIAWLIPCHRVIRSDGQVGGYRWGVAMKRACLAYENVQVANLSKNEGASKAKPALSGFE